MPIDSPKSKSGQVRSARRREELRRSIPKPTIDVRSLLTRRDLINTIVVCFGFFVVVSGLIIWSYGEPKLHLRQIMTESRLKRVDFQIIDHRQTESQREAARARAPRVYQINQPYLDELEAALLGLPIALGGKSDLSAISAEITDTFRVTQERLEAMQQHVDAENQPSADWQRWVRNLLRERLPNNPMIASRDWQIELTKTSRPELRTANTIIRPPDQNVIELKPESIGDLQPRLATLVNGAGFPADIAPLVMARLMHQPKPVFNFWAEETDRRAEAAAAAVAEVTIPHRAGEVLHRRGDVLSGEQYDLILTEQAEYAATPEAQRERWMSMIGIASVVAMAALILGGYLSRFYPRVTRNPLRLLALTGLMTGMLAVVIAVAVQDARFMIFAAVSATLLVAFLGVIAYDQRLAALVSGVQCLLVSFAVEQSIGFFVLLAAISGTAIASLREIRHRNSLIQASAMAAIVAGVGAVLLGVLGTPLVPGAWSQTLYGAALASAAGLATGFILLGVLPTIERAFDMTTGMTLVEYRDPRHPLLRLLQERAPGTYNHSLQVASIAEAASEAIGANGLLTYVGALYHDIGKMNKPDYFVENQGGGANKHDKLSPAMSLLVIVGHVKDGIELAREYNLPRVLHHFIESHHGTTLVEYFYHAARNKAEHEGEKVEEVEFRYTGPKPQTKEAAILMLSDGVESATRAMAEPTPASIENLVRKMASKRLRDGQFSACDLTFRELRIIEDSLIKSVWALHHGRVSYPGDERREKSSQSQTQSPAGVASATARPA